jgi:multiple sugar transport system ATP-binding protein
VIKERVTSVAGLLGITDLLDRYPAQISGGQRQRVAVARAIAIRSDVLLMDEPLSNLDALLRMQMRAELKALLQELGTTTIYVTHDQTEALSMGDRIAVMNSGRIVQVDTPLQVYDNPRERFVGDFVGTPPMNFLAARVERNGGAPTVRVSGGTFPLPAAAPAPADRDLLLGIRAEAIAVEAARSDDAIVATVVVVEPLGSHNLITVRTGDETLKVSTPNNVFPEPGSDIWLLLKADSMRWFDRETGRAIEQADRRTADVLASA